MASCFFLFHFHYHSSSNHRQHLFSLCVLVALNSAQSHSSFISHAPYSRTLLLTCISWSTIIFPLEYVNTEQCLIYGIDSVFVSFIFVKMETNTKQSIIFSINLFYAEHFFLSFIALFQTRKYIFCTVHINYF